jgi:hypothetical protein
MQEVVETLHAETLWNHHWEGGKGAGVELAIPKGCRVNFLCASKRVRNHCLTEGAEPLAMMI